MGVNRRLVGAFPSAAAAIGTPSVTIAKKKFTLPEQSGILIVADLTAIAGNGTILPNVYVGGPGDTHFGLLYKGGASDGATTGIQMWQLYPQGLEGASVAGTAIRGRGALAVPLEFWIDWDVATQIVTFAAEIWELQ